MKAMIFAAGLGTRLRPLTATRPKALIEINQVPLLEIVIRRLLAVGVREIIINTHYLAGQIAAFLNAKNNFGVRIELSHEEELLDTGGGLQKAGYFFDDGKPFFVHNVDVISNIDLMAIYRQHLAQDCLATLAVKARKTSRYFLFDEAGQLCGWKSLQENRVEVAHTPAGQIHELAFDGIHVISPELLQRMTETGAFSILKTYLRLAGEGEKICAYRTEGFYWQDVGKIEQLEEINKQAALGLLNN